MPPDSPNPSPTQEVETWPELLVAGIQIGKVERIGPNVFYGIVHSGDASKYGDGETETYVPRRQLQAEVEKREEVERLRQRAIDAQHKTACELEAAESKLSSAVEELEGQVTAAGQIEDSAETDRMRMFWAGIRFATETDLDLLRGGDDKVDGAASPVLSASGLVPGASGQPGGEAASGRCGASGRETGAPASDPGVSIEGDPGPSSDEEKAAEVLVRFMCCPAGREFVERRVLARFGYSLDPGPVLQEKANLIDALEQAQACLGENRQAAAEQAIHRALSTQQQLEQSATGEEDCER